MVKMNGHSPQTTGEVIELIVRVPSPLSSKLTPSNIEHTVKLGISPLIHATYWHTTYWHAKYPSQNISNAKLKQTILM